MISDYGLNDSTVVGWLRNSGGSKLVQRQAARFVTGDYSSRDRGSVTRMLQQLQWDTLEERRARSRSIMLYGILNNLVEVSFQVTMILGRNEYLYASTLVLICRMLWAQDPLVLVVLI
jgi:hypothetical protein